MGKYYLLLKYDMFNPNNTLSLLCGLFYIKGIAYNRILSISTHNQVPWYQNKDKHLGWYLCQKCLESKKPDQMFHHYRKLYFDILYNISAKNTDIYTYESIPRLWWSNNILNPVIEGYLSQNCPQKGEVRQMFRHYRKLYLISYLGQYYRY